MDKLWQQIDQLGLNLYTVAVMTDDGLFHHRFQPCSLCHNGYSVTKAFAVTAIGLLYDDGLVRPEDRISRYLPLPATADPRWQEVTVDHLLTHKTGAGHGFLDIDVEDVRAWQTDEYLDLAFAQPLPHAPGTQEVYSDGAFYLLSRIVSAACGQTMDELLLHRVLKPLNFGEVAWSRCPKGHPIGATGMYAQAQDVVKLGWLYLNGGLWQDQRILSPEWVELVLTRGYELRPMPFGWIGKAGMYGQQVALHPQKRTAVAWYGFNPGAHLQPLLQCIDDFWKGDATHV